MDVNLVLFCAVSSCSCGAVVEWPGCDAVVGCLPGQ